MKRLRYYTIIGTLFVLISGTLSHFLYHWTGKNFLIGFFCPVNESVWEHMKLVFFPMLFYFSVMTHNLKAEYPRIVCAASLGILTGTLLIPAIFYTYTFILGKNLLVLDLMTFAVSVITGFFITYRCALSGKRTVSPRLLYCMVGLFFTGFIIFTYHAPDIEPFANPDTCNTD